MPKVYCRGKSGWSQAQVDELDRAMRVLSDNGIGFGSLPFDTLYDLRGRMVRFIGIKLPKPVTILKKLVGLSPGVINIWHDSEGGFFTQARAEPSSPWAVHYVTDKTALTLLKGGLTHDLVDTLMTPDSYLGE